MALDDVRCVTIPMHCFRLIWGIVPDHPGFQFYGNANSPTLTLFQYKGHCTWAQRSLLLEFCYSTMRFTQRLFWFEIKRMWIIFVPKLLSNIFSIPLARNNQIDFKFCIKYFKHFGYLYIISSQYTLKTGHSVYIDHSFIKCFPIYRKRLQTMHN